MNLVERARNKLLEAWNAYSAAGGTQLGLAKATGLNQGTISAWIVKLKAGEAPKLEGMVALAEGMGLPPESLFVDLPPALPGIDPELVTLFAQVAADPEMAPLLKTYLERLAGQQDEANHG